MISSFGTYFASNALCIPCFVVCMPCCFVSVHNVFLKYWGTDTRAVAHLKLCGDRPPVPLSLRPRAEVSARVAGYDLADCCASTYRMTTSWLAVSTGGGGGVVEGGGGRAGS